MLRKVVPDVVRDQKLVTLAPTASVREAAQKMAARNVRSVLVTSRGRLKGIFTGTDLINRVVAAGRDPDTTTLREVMTPQPASIAPGDNALEALRLMQTGGYRHLPVLEGHQLRGIVSRRDFLGFELDEIEREAELWQRV
jgi:CBS domain-containing protein